MGSRLYYLFLSHFLCRACKTGLKRRWLCRDGDLDVVFQDDLESLYFLGSGREMVLHPVMWHSPEVGLGEYS